ncbi:hypothetical protein Bbelb_202230 [Branchiostoma belcheri]|nr:hypothetical protein Bbelb_202230 [Branchiostoma belcheri]
MRSGHTPGNRFGRRAKPGEGSRLGRKPSGESLSWECLSQHAKTGPGRNRLDTCPATGIGWELGRESEADDIAQLSLTLIHFTRKSKTSQNKSLKPCGEGQIGEAAGEDTLGAVATNPHTGGPGHVVALYWTEAAVEFGSLLGPEEGARKGALKIACFTSPWPVRRGRRGSQQSGKHSRKKTLVRALTIGTWNVRTLMDSAKAERPERRTALVARELDRYNIQIAALSETRFANEGQLTEANAGYTFFWSGRSSEERREAGVGFAIKSNLISRLTNLPKGVNDRLMTLRLPMKGKCQATFISAYAPTMTNPEEVKDKFYEDLEALIMDVPKGDKLVILGDFNARVGTDYQTWDGVLGRNGIGKCNSNGHLLLKTCATHDLVITNTIFRQPNRNKTSWMHPRSKHWHLIDYVIVRRRDRQDVRVTKSMCGADCWTDHRLIRSKLNMHIKPKRRPQGKPANKRLNTRLLEDSSVKNNLRDNLDNKLRDLNFCSNGAEEDWTALKEVLYNTARSHLGLQTRKHQDWFDENDEDIQKLLDEKHAAYRAFQQANRSDAKKALYNASKAKVQAKLREMQDSWLSHKADEIQMFADSNNTKHFYDALKAIYGPQSTGTSPLLSADGTTLITDKDKILERWAEHFCNVLNRPSVMNDEAINDMPQVPVNITLDELPTEQEVQQAIQLLSNGKAPGSDAIPAEVYKAGGTVLTQKLTEFFQSLWEKEEIPQEFKDASIVHLYKRKGNRQSCDNHRGISLLVIAGKILARVLLNRLIQHMDEHLPESQCGFREGRGTADMIFAARQLQEKCQEQNRDLYTTL